jgi:hypothetical protein
LVEFYDALSDCDFHGNMHMTQFDILQMNLHVYNNDKKQLLGDRKNIMRAILKDYAKTMEFSSGAVMM